MKTPLQFNPIIMNNFWQQVIHKLDEIVKRLNSVLNIRTAVGEQYRGVPVKRLAEDVIDAVNRKDKNHAEIALLMLEKLIEDLERIRNYDIKLFRDYKRRLKRESETEYRGLRFEIGTASAFIKGQIPFIAPKSKTSKPDFKITCPKGFVAVECTIREAPITTSSDLTYKIKAAIKEKSEKPYAGPDTVLFLDITNLVYSRIETKHILKNLSLRQEVSEILQKFPLGSVLLIGYFIEDSPIVGKRYSRVYLRCDASNMGKNSKWFLDTYYPVTDSRELINWSVPDIP